jgi:diazepam-binding inhibitor (GABA receptor modulating acyl-CoA-binding protein)
MEIKIQFEQALEQVKTLTKRPSNENLLTMYALYKQATDGDVSGARPGMFDLKGQAKYDAWVKQKGKSAEVAMQEYIDLVQQMSEA